MVIIDHPDKDRYLRRRMFWRRVGGYWASVRETGDTSRSLSRDFFDGFALILDWLAGKSWLYVIACVAVLVDVMIHLNTTPLPPGPWLVFLGLAPGVWALMLRLPGRSRR